MRVTPKISVRPAAMRKSDEADAEAVQQLAANDASDTSIGCATRCDVAALARGGPRAASIGRAQPPHDVVGRQGILAVRVVPVDHHALAVAHLGAADVGAHRRLMIDRAKGHRAERRVDAQALHRRDELLGVGRARLAQSRRPPP